ncbi:unnamed protein product [Pleuronectes platessa]|uniref:Uncharacterized protein n=1 Tax=Pleuronectes platessa TaxID=8262 RepID=A0A9N7V9L8_PLEPL|nr:unnamed protein product [Pleuronectes platessa]
MRLLSDPASSFGSLSLAMTPPPEDEVAAQLQRLVDQCCHGNNYCKQVLSLYQLSKCLARGHFGKKEERRIDG